MIEANAVKSTEDFERLVAKLDLRQEARYARYTASLKGIRSVFEDFCDALIAQMDQISRNHEALSRSLDRLERRVATLESAPEPSS